MAKSPETTHTPQADQDPSRRVMDAVTQWQAAGLGALNWFGASTAKRMQDMGAEWAVFVAERVREDVALQHALLHAKSPSEVQAIQMKFLQTAMEQYSAETGRMFARGTKLFEGHPEEEDPKDNVNV